MCTVCKKGFIASDGLKRHQKTHAKKTEPQPALSTAAVVATVNAPLYPHLFVRADRPTLLQRSLEAISDQFMRNFNIKREALGRLSDFSVLVDKLFDMQRKFLM